MAVPGSAQALTAAASLIENCHSSPIQIFGSYPLPTFRSKSHLSAKNSSYL